MARRRRQALARRIAFVSFFLVVTSSLAVFAQQPAPPIATPDPLNVPVETETPEIAEANKAYLKALRAIRTLSSLSSSQVSAYYADVHPQPSGLMMSLFPNEQGPIPKLVKLWYSLRPQNLIPDWLARRFGGRLGRRREEIRAYASKAVELLTLAIERGHEDALFTMAEVSLFPPPAMHLNVSRAFHYYFKHAETTGNATSQAMLGFFYATGYGGAVEIDQSQALLYYTFAALGGFQRAEMVMGYRYWAGIGVNEDCMAALGWYENAAEKSMNYFMSGPPGGRTLPNSITRLSDLDGGVYGPGASVASTGSNSGRSVMKAASSRAAGETWEDVLEYYHYHAERGEVDFAYRLGKIYYHGSVYTASGGAASGAEGVGAIGRDFARARSYFVSITRLVWPANSINFPLVNKKEVEERISTAAAMAAGYMGRMHLRGEGVKQDFMVARMWFERGAEYGDRESQMGLGLIHRDGLIDGKIDLGKAMNYFTAAAGQDLAEAQVQLGKHYYEMGDYGRATTFFESAIHHGSPFEPYYYIAEMHSNQAHSAQATPSTRAGSCSIAVAFYKLVAERGSWKDDLIGDAERLWDFNGVRTGIKSATTFSGPGSSRGSSSSYLRQLERDAATLRWWIAAEAGVEVAQNNLAYLFDQDRSALRHTSFTPQPSNATARLALTQWIRSASQRNVDALVKVGDYYYHGLGVSDEPQEVRWEKAAGYYHQAVETQVSALAMWNLGWMYENGVGVMQDFHLAKRYYDMALETNSEAYFPVVLSLIKLYLRSLWYSVTGGTEKSLTLWTGDGMDDHWYLGKARLELKKRWSGDQRQLDDAHGDAPANAVGYDDGDSVQWARDRRREEAERAQAEHDADGGFGPEDYFDAAISGPGRRDGNPDRDDTVDDLIFMLVLCGILTALIYLRTRYRLGRERREQAQAAPPQPPQ